MSEQLRWEGWRDRGPSVIGELDGAFPVDHTLDVIALVHVAILESVGPEPVWQPMFIAPAVPLPVGLRPQMYGLTYSSRRMRSDRANDFVEGPTFCQGN
jgi:hypothetical protein